MEGHSIRGAGNLCARSLASQPTSRGWLSQQSLEFHSQRRRCRRRRAGPKPETGQGWALLEANQLLHPPKAQHRAGMYLGLGIWLCASGRPPDLSKPCFPTYKPATVSALESSGRPTLGLVPCARCAVLDTLHLGWYPGLWLRGRGGVWSVCPKLDSGSPHLPFPRQDLGLRAADSSRTPWEPQRDLVVCGQGDMGHLGTGKHLGGGHTGKLQQQG